MQKHGFIIIIAIFVHDICIVYNVATVAVAKAIIQGGPKVGLQLKVGLGQKI